MTFIFIVSIKFLLNIKEYSNKSETFKVRSLMNTMKIKFGMNSSVNKVQKGKSYIKNK